MRVVLSLLLNVLVVGLFLYSKLLPHKDRLDSRYRGIFNFFNVVLTPVLNFMKKLVTPFQVGQGLSIDLTQLIVLIVLLIFLTLR